MSRWEDREHGYMDDGEAEGGAWDWVTPADDEAMWQEHLEAERKRAAKVLSPAFYVKLRTDADILVDFWQQREDAKAALEEGRETEVPFHEADALFERAVSDFAEEYSEMTRFASSAGWLEYRPVSELMAELGGGVDDELMDGFKSDARTAVLEGMPFRPRMDFVERDMALGAEPDPPEAQRWMDKETLSQFKSRDVDVEWARSQHARSSEIMLQRTMSKCKGNEPWLTPEEAEALGYGKTYDELENEAQAVGDAAEERLSGFVNYAEHLMDRQPVLFDVDYRDVFERFVDSQDPVRNRTYPSYAGAASAQKAEGLDLSRVDLGRKGVDAPAKADIGVQKDAGRVFAGKDGMKMPDVPDSPKKTFGWGED